MTFANSVNLFTVKKLPKNIMSETKIEGYSEIYMIPSHYFHVFSLEM